MPTSLPSNDPSTSKKARRDTARAQAAALRDRQRRQTAHRRVAGIGTLVLAVLLLATVVVVVAIRASSPSAGGIAYPSGSPTTAAIHPPASADATLRGVPVSAAGVGRRASGGVVVDLYFDFMCTGCGRFDRTNAADLATLSAEPGVTLVYHPVSILDRLSQGTAYSTRAANAAAVIADQDPSHLPAFVTALFARQPDEDTPGLSDDEIAQVAASIGVPAPVRATFIASVSPDGAPYRTFAPWIAWQSTLIPKAADGRTYTPTIALDGTYWDGDPFTAGVLRAAVESARG